MAKSNLQLKPVVFAYLPFLWCSLAYAAEDSLVRDLSAISPMTILVVWGISIVGGLAGTLNKISKNDPPIRNTTLEVCKDIFMSMVMGMLMFFFISWSPIDSAWPKAILITFAGYGGSKLIENSYTEVVGPAILAFMKRLLAVFGISPKDGGTT